MSYVATPILAIELASAIGSGTISITGNTINGVSQNSSSATSKFGGILISSAGGPFSVTNNTISNIDGFNTTNTSGSAGGVGIDVATAATSATISGNNITKVYNRGSGYAARGIVLNGGNNVSVQNNYISNVLNVGNISFSLTYGAFGILANGGTGHKIYHNSVNLFGTNTGTGSNLTACFGILASSQTGIDVRNNIFSNTMTSSVASNANVSIYLPSGGTNAMNLTLNNNAYYTGTTAGVNGICHAGTTYTSPNNATAGLWTAANFSSIAITPSTNLRSYTSVLSSAGTNDNSSFATTSAAPFVSSTDLHITTGTTPTLLESWGVSTSITSVTTDIDGDARPGPTGSTNGGASAPDLGADEFDGAPSLSMSYTSSTTEQVTGSAYAGVTNQSIIRVKIVTTGVTSPLSLTNLTLNANGTTAIGDINAATAKVYYTGASTTFGTSSLFGATTPTIANFTVTGSQALVEGNNYFWLAYDVAAAATSANLIDGECIDLTVGSVRTPTITAPSGSKSILGAMSGTYAVGASQTENGSAFTKLTTAIADLNSRGVSGAVIFALQSDYTSATETFPLTINAITGASGTNTVTIKPASGVTATISGSAASSALIKIASKYVIIDGSNTAGGTTRDLTITNTSTTTPNVLLIGNSGTSTATALTDVTVKNTILINGVNTSSAVIVANNTSAAGYFNNITIQNNSVQKAYIGIYALATAATGNGSGLLITGNDLNTSGANAITYIGIYVQGVDGATVSNNNIANITSSVVSPYGVVFYTGTNSGSISGNTISALSYTGAYDYAPSGIISTASTATNILIYNNIISNISSSAAESSYYPTPSGINISSINTSAYNNKIFNIKQTNTGGEQALGINLSSVSTTSGISVYNNFIFDIAGYGWSSIYYNGHGIGLLSGGGYNLYNNTINMNTNQSLSTSFSSAIYISSSLVTAASVNIRNNIFANTQTGGANVANRYAIYCAATSNTIFGTINHNSYYTSGTHLGSINGSNRTTLNNLKNSSNGFGQNPTRA